MFWRDSSPVTFLALTLYAAAAHAQTAPPAALKNKIYFLAATPSGNTTAQFGAELYTFNAAGHLTLLRDVVTQDAKGRERGIDFVLPDYESRLIFIGTPNISPNTIETVLMDSPTQRVSSIVKIPDLRSAPWNPRPASDQAVWDRALAPGHINMASLVEARIIRSARGKYLALFYSSDRGDLLSGYPITPQGPGAPVFLPERDSVDVVAYGDFGLARLGFTDRVLVAESGQRVVRFRDGIPRDLGLPAPPGMRASQKAPCHLVVHNSRMSVIDLMTGENGTNLAVWSPVSQKWRNYHVPGEGSSIRSMENWILGAALSAKNGRISPGEDRRKARAELSASPGNAARRKRPNTNYWFKESDAYYPGLLYLIDTDTGRMLQFQTGQGDSEILLVHDPYVYYRVNNQLFAAPLLQTGVGQPQLLAEDNVVPDIHWAFAGK